MNRSKNPVLVYYRDFGPAFRNPDGSVNAARFADGVHLNHVGYEIPGNHDP